MNKVEYLKNFESTSLYSSSLFNGFLQSLSPNETISVLDLTFDQDPRFRRYILNKILIDAENDFKNSHGDLVYKLLQSFSDLPYKKINSCGYCLSHLFPCLPDNLKNDVLNFFLSNKYVVVRRRGYKILKNSWSKEFKSQIINNWEKFNDPECVQLFIEHFDIAFILDHFKAFEEALQEDWQIRKLYLKNARHDKAILDYIKTIDEITYCYILVKLGETLSESEALDIYENNSRDERIGLLVWCFGKMNLWQVLVEIENDTRI
jgi:hypothetical protein